MKYERINKNSNAQQANRRGMWVLYNPLQFLDANGKPSPFRYSPDRKTVRDEVKKDLKQMRKAIAQQNKEEREKAAQDNKVPLESREELGTVAGREGDQV